jgi:type IV secretory pathway component VirB8
MNAQLNNDNLSLMEKYLKSTKSIASTEIEMVRSSRNLYKWLFLMMTFLLFVSMMGGYFIWLKMAEPIAPAIIEVNRITGQLQTIQINGVKQIGAIQALQESLAGRYVTCRETYSFETLSEDHTCASELSIGEALDSYNKIYSGEDARHKILAATQKWKIKINNVQISPSQADVAVVRFTKTVSAKGLDASGEFTARLTFTFLDNQKLSEELKFIR